ncbi:MAG TPA: TauD/TfdA family dioxygenase [Thermoanaerobaculia bacterium]|nr:TauD/TfdA family dioxygenase [Thermoanaerobaculia bacterium]
MSEGPKSGIGGFKRKVVSVATDSLVEMHPLLEGGSLPLLAVPCVPGVDLHRWAESQRALLDDSLVRHGGLLFRGFGLRQPGDLERLIRAIAGESLEYRERSSPRSVVAGRIYTSTDYPPNYSIFLHNENSYQNVWPLRIFFFCQVEPTAGGETPIADVRRVFAHIDPEVRERFIAKGWMYVRNFGDGLGLGWKTVFQTSDRAQVEEHCRRSGIEVEWKAGDRLRTRAVRPAMAKHPRTGERLWFNHAAFFHVSTHEPEVAKALRQEFGEEDLPANTYYGDGSRIEPEVLDHLRSAYHQATICFPWQQGDVLLLDNMIVAHGRAPFLGNRTILVGMAEPVTREEAL